jgi:AraC family transcriptional regulator of adaptative response / DNA-3-methyladenine glycosylase II
MNAPTDLDDDARYRALCSRDARFDGRFFVGVSSTGIYCRPICAVKTPRRENCHFFAIPAQAEQAGFRPCLRCRPELAPAQRHWSSTDAGSILLHQALQWLDHAPDTGPAPSATELAAHLGVSDRHLRRIFEQHLGVSPLQYRQTRQLLRAKQWLSDTALPVAEVAWRAGFGSVRRFNDAVRRHYGMSPTELRRGAGQGRSGGGLFLSAREPWDANAWLGFLQRHATPGVEQVDPSAGRWQRTVRLIDADGQARHGWLSAQVTRRAGRSGLTLRVSEGLAPVLPLVMERVRAVADLDADPAAIDAVLGATLPHGQGLRVAGAFDGFELAVQAVLGQQVTLAAARALGARLVAHTGQPIDTGTDGLAYLFPSPERIADTSAEALGRLGLIRQRQTALLALARAVLDGRLPLSPGADPDTTLDTLQSLPGIGPWTAHYIAMRALAWPDAWPAQDVVIHRALGLSGSPAQNSRQAIQLAEPWRPWRAYAAMRLWQSTLTEQPT